MSASKGTKYTGSAIIETLLLQRPVVDSLIDAMLRFRVAREVDLAGGGIGHAV
jgi:hypothetical protein